MPPSSRRSLRHRRDAADAQQQSDADTPDSIATPSRKRRRLNGAQEAVAAAEPPRARVAESVASNDSNTTLPNGGDLDNPTDPVERQNLVIASLRMPRHYTPNAVIDYANDLQARRNEGKNIAAFAKIAAREWCFFVQETRVLIGRADSAIRPHPPSAASDLSGLPLNEAAVSQWGVHIDLGPERQISRVHAEINFNPQDQIWYIMVNSRNGLKLDDRNLTKGQVEPLHSGVCIGIMGTQMLFLLANQEDNFHPMLWRQVNNEDAAESDNDSKQPPKPQHHAHPSGPTPKREHYDPFPPSSHPRHKQQQSSQAFYNQMTSTPHRGPPGTPLTFRNEQDPRSKGSPAVFSRGMLFDANDDIDYSLDSSKDIKPPHSYAQLIGQAILSSDEEMLTLSNIYDYIKLRYAYFRFTNAGWQNSIRHNLSLNKSFEKVARRTDEPGKGMKWKIADHEREEFIKKQMLNPRKGGGIAIGNRLDGSGPSSPAVGHRDGTAQATERLVGVLDHDYRNHSRVKSPPRSATPPLSSVPMATESYTPDRGPRPFGGLKQSPSIRDHHNFVTPAKRLMYGEGGREHQYIKHDDSRRHLESSPAVDPVKPSVSGLKGEAANSPPTLYSDNNPHGHHDTGRMNNALVTPLVTRHAPRLAPPSTAQMPSQYMNFSSPAPFWKFVDLPSTPARGPLELSPIKLQRPDGKDDNDNDDSAQPSSPPMLNEGESVEPEDEDAEDNKAEEDDDVGPESPSRTVSRPVSRRDLGPPRSRSNSNVNNFGPTGNGGMVRGASLTSFEEEPEAEEESYDLSKGFQKIGSFHRSIAQAHGLGITHTATPPPPPSRTSVPANI